MVVLSTWQTRVKHVKNFLAEVTRPEGKCDWMACITIGCIIVVCIQLATLQCAESKSGLRTLE